VELNPAIPIDGLDTEVLVRLAVAAIIGLLLGLDRELRGHAAGLRTHGIICFAAAIMTVSMLSLYQQMGSVDTRMDPLRIFEGTGAFIGIACGAGQWPLVAIGSVMAFVMITLLGIIESRWLKKTRTDRGDAESN